MKLLFFLSTITLFFVISIEGAKNEQKNINLNIDKQISQFNKEQTEILKEFLKQNKRISEPPKDNKTFPLSFKREDNKVNVYLFCTFSIHFDKDFLSHFLTYYLNQSIEPSHFFLNFHLDVTLSHEEQEKDFNLFNSFFVPFLKENNIKHYLIWYGAYTTLQMKISGKFLENFIPNDGWIVRLDSDEFLSPPPVINQFFAAIDHPVPNLVDLIVLLDEFGFNYIKGHFVDRFSFDCSLQPILPLPPFSPVFNNNNNTNNIINNNIINNTNEFKEEILLLSEVEKDLEESKIKSIFEQFPCRSNFTKDRVHNQKASITRSNIRTTVGNHCLVVEIPCTKGTPPLTALILSPYENNSFYYSLSRDNVEKFLKFLAKKFNKVKKFNEIRKNIKINLEELTIHIDDIFISYINDLQMEVNHFKWNNIVIDKLRKRISDYKLKNYDWRSESEESLSFFDENGRAIKSIDGCPC